MDSVRPWQVLVKLGSWHRVGYYATKREAERAAEERRKAPGWVIVVPVPHPPRPCRICGIWACRACGVKTYQVRLSLTACPSCGSPDGTLGPALHNTSTKIAREHA